jgi:hypothetical protein
MCGLAGWLWWVGLGWLGMGMGCVVDVVFIFG